MSVQDIAWFHSIDLGNGTITNGMKHHWQLETEANFYFRSNLARGKSVLDIGAWDGFMSFEAERRGASRVVASDHFCWSGPGWGTKAGFDLAHQIIGSKVETREVDVFDLDPNQLGVFDIVLFPGVLYHLTDPYGGLAKAAAMTQDLLIVETATAMNHIQEPVMRYYLGAELNNDPTNFWAPNAPCLRNMLIELGFQRIESTIHALHEGPERLIMHAWRS